MVRKLWFLGFLTVAVLASLSAAGAVMVRMPLDDLVQDSAIVVHGKVVSSTPFRKEPKGNIFTAHVVEVTEYLRGEGEGRVRVITMGGEMEDFGQIVPGEAKLAVGEEVVLCLLEASEHDGYVVTGMSQGKFRVEKRDAGPTLVRDYRGVMFIGEKKQELSPKGDDLSFETFRALVRSLKK